MHAARCIEEELSVHQNAAFVRPGKARQGIEDERFPGPARAEENSGSQASTEMNVQFEWLGIACGR